MSPVTAIISLLLTTLLIVPLSLAQKSKYCNPSLCNGQKNVNIGCPGVLKSSCPSDVKVLNMDDYKDFVVRRHNELRNSLAAGNIGLPKADRLSEVVWDDELSYLATLNAKQCRMEHDKCRNTEEFPYAGQNIASSFGYPSDNASIANAIDNWWNEHKQATAQDMAKFSNSAMKSGHFTAMANQKSVKVGCGGVTFNGKQRVFVCNYSFTNGLGVEVYNAGKTAADCKTDKSKSYPNLCSKNEPINYKSFW